MPLVECGCGKTYDDATQSGACPDHAAYPSVLDASFADLEDGVSHEMPSYVKSRIWRTAEAMQGKIAAEIRVMLGESKLPTTLFTPDQIQRRIDAMRKCAAESTSDTERHDAWMKMHLDGGWTYAPGEFDPVNKTHPNLLPWDQLPATVKSKARIFDIVAKAFASLENLGAPPTDAELTPSPIPAPSEPVKSEQLAQAATKTPDNDGVTQPLSENDLHAAAAARAQAAHRLTPAAPVPPDATVQESDVLAFNGGMAPPYVPPTPPERQS